MDPRDRSCHNPDCPARGQRGPDNIRVHSRKERRYRCTACDRTFAMTTVQWGATEIRDGWKITVTVRAWGW
jgi:transposase-like protein